MSTSDDQLISAYLEGDESALAVLVDHYLPDAYRFACSLTGDAQVAEDVVQESFIKAWKNARRFIPGNSFKKWLFAIVRNTAIDSLRQRKDVAFSVFQTAEGGNTLVSALADEQPLPDVLLTRAMDLEYLQRLLEQLNPEYREVLSLRHTSNMTFEEIGQVLKRPLHTVKSQYRRSIIALQRLVESAAA